MQEEDSDDSVILEDILPSSYPVKPRKTPKWPQAGQTQTYVAEDEELEEEFGLEETMELFRIIEKVNTRFVSSLPFFGFLQRDSGDFVAITPGPARNF